MFSQDAPEFHQPSHPGVLPPVLVDHQRWKWQRWWRFPHVGRTTSGITFLQRCRQANLNINHWHNILFSKMHPPPKKKKSALDQQVAWPPPRLLSFMTNSGLYLTWPCFFFWKGADNPVFSLLGQNTIWEVICLFSKKRPLYLLVIFLCIWAIKPNLERPLPCNLSETFLMSKTLQIWGNNWKLGRLSPQTLFCDFLFSICIKTRRTY